MKLRLSLLVVFSACIGYMMAAPAGFGIYRLLAFCFGSLLITASANTINQIIEKDFDSLMIRTRNRPLPMHVLGNREAVLFSVLTGIIGMALMVFYTNLLATSIALLSLCLYAFVYTPMKRISPLAVLVGAIPGALPPLIGWVAISGTITIEPLILFAIQFIWQFPHFWAIAWVLDEDYKKAGFRLLPGAGGRDANTAFQIMVYTLLLLPLGLLPTLFGITGLTSAIVSTVCGCLFLALTFSLLRNCSRESALKIMFGSFFYLPIVQITFLLDKI